MGEFDKLKGLSEVDTSGDKAMLSYMKALPFENIIGAPLMACVKAQSESAKATWNAIREIGFVDSHNTTDSNVQEMASLSFLYQQNGMTRKITVPLLTIVPLPYMQIDTVDLKFRADMSTTSEGQITAKYSNTMDSQATRRSKYNNTNEIEVNIHATSAGMPAGLAKMLDLFTNTCISVADYTPDEYGDEIIKAAKEEAEKMMAKAREEVEKLKQQNQRR